MKEYHIPEFLIPNYKRQIKLMRFNAQCRTGVSNTHPLGHIRPTNSVSSARVTFKIQKVLNVSTKNWWLLSLTTNVARRTIVLSICGPRTIFIQWPSSAFEFKTPGVGFLSVKMSFKTFWLNTISECEMFIQKWVSYQEDRAVQFCDARSLAIQVIELSFAISKLSTEYASV